MHPVFSKLVESLQPKYEQLIGSQPLDITEYKVKDVRSGVYLLSESNNHLYVGRSRDIRRRYCRHCYPGSPPSCASFAVKLAREKTNKMAKYISGHSDLKTLIQDPGFMKAFHESKSRIRSMDFRFVEEDDPNRQTLLEIYCAIALNTPYNDFDTH